jgi:uncharacterized protein YdbL (DUF1318 family)
MATAGVTIASSATVEDAISAVTVEDAIQAAAVVDMAAAQQYAVAVGMVAAVQHAVAVVEHEAAQQYVAVAQHAAVVVEHVAAVVVEHVAAAVVEREAAVVVDIASWIGRCLKQRLESTLQSTAAEQTSSAVFALESPVEKPGRTNRVNSVVGFKFPRPCNLFLRENVAPGT